MTLNISNSIFVSFSSYNVFWKSRFWSFAWSCTKIIQETRSFYPDYSLPSKSTVNRYRLASDSKDAFDTSKRHHQKVFNLGSDTHQKQNKSHEIFMFTNFMSISFTPTNFCFNMFFIADINKDRKKICHEDWKISSGLQCVSLRFEFS